VDADSELAPEQKKLPSDRHEGQKLESSFDEVSGQSVRGVKAEDRKPGNGSEGRERTG
jgi:hypothetical protein